MQRLSEIALALLTLSEEVVTSIATHGKEIAARLVELWTAPGQGLPEGQTPPDFEGNLAALQGVLDASGKRTAAADRRHVRQLAVTMDLRGKIREVTARAYRKLSKIRRIVDEIHGDGKAFVLTGIEGPTAEAPRKLLRQCKLAFERLLDPELELPSHELDGLTVDPVKMALGLQADADLLRSLLADLRRERRLLQKTRKEKNRANAAHNHTLVWTSRIAQGYYMLAGEVELAERLRPATRRKTRPASAPDSTPDGRTPEGETPTEETSTEETSTEGTTPAQVTPPAEVTEASAPAPSPTDA